jgi:hypothetical protein
MRRITAQQGVPAGITAESRVNAALQTLPAPGPHHPVDDVAPQASLHRLAPLDHAGLALE